MSNQSVVRAGLRLLLQEWGWGEVTEAPLEPFLGTPAQRSTLGIVIIDASQTWDRCLEALSQFQRTEPLSPVLVLSAYKEPGYAKAALECGARGYILEQASKEEFRVACWAVNQGGLYIDPQVAAGLLRAMSKPEAQFRRAAILAGLSRGASNQMLASELSLSVSSIKMCIRELFAEYGVRCRLELLAAVGSRNRLDATPPP